MSQTKNPTRVRKSYTRQAGKTGKTYADYLRDAGYDPRKYISLREDELTNESIQWKKN